MEIVKKRNMILQVLICIFTFGIYTIYWFYQTAKEFKIITKDENISPGLWTGLMFIPFGVFYSYYQYAKAYEKIGSEKINRWILYIFFFAIPPLLWFLVQMDLNKYAEKQPQLAKA